MHEVWGTVVGRWYVTLFGLTFLWCAVRQLGWRRTAVYGLIAVSIGALAENGSVHFGFPYTSYSFNPALRGKELWIGDVPLFVPLSYTFMGYFAFASGRLLASGPWRTRARRPWMELLLAWMLAVWALWVVDPVSRLGDQFYLVALPWVVLQITGSGVAMGTVAMAAGIPRAVLMLLGGAATDRTSPRYLLMATWRRGMGTDLGRRP